MSIQLAKITGAPCGALVLLLVAFLVAVPDAEARKKKSKDLPQTTHDGLELVTDSRADAAWVKPGADFSGYDRIQLLDCYVAFKKYWAQRYNRESVNKVTSRDVERMKSDLAELFREVFVEVLDTEGGYPVVDEAADDVLVLRPGIIDLDVTAPDTQSQSRSYSFAASAGSATLYLELYDSVSGEILARVIDHQVARDHGGVMRWTNRVANRQAAIQILGKWATTLRDRLDEVHGRETGGLGPAAAEVWHHRDRDTILATGGLLPWLLGRREASPPAAVGRS